MYGLQERAYGTLMGDLIKGDHLEILVFSGSGKGQVTSDCECGNEISGSTKMGIC
jgi:hypothetical protein